jgi:hypothetical protein
MDIVPICAIDLHITYFTVLSRQNRDDVLLSTPYS